eukprot:15464305-Alexandrium_andersonii.AAC.1
MSASLVGSEMCIRDRLSRQHAPVPNQFPMILASVRRSIVPLRNADCYHHAQPRRIRALLRPYSGGSDPQ